MVNEIITFMVFMALQTFTLCVGYWIGHEEGIIEGWSRECRKIDELLKHSHLHASNLEAGGEEWKSGG